MARSLATIISGACTLAVLDSRYLIPIQASLAFDIALNSVLQEATMTVELLIQKTIDELYRRLSPQTSEAHRSVVALSLVVRTWVSQVMLLIGEP